jgi:predicted alpha/beta-hydrolase family hydrolase
LLVAMANAFVQAGFLILRCDLPFRQERLFGPPFPNGAKRDRDGLRRALALMKERVSGQIFAGGHSYGGRQASMLLADEPELAAGLLLLSYPLHPPRKPTELRTAHFPRLNTPAMFVHGSRDPFASLEEMKSALAIIPARHVLMEIDGAGHELLKKKVEDDLAVRVAGAFGEFVA